jgi:hypothetical protein
MMHGVRVRMLNQPTTPGELRDLMGEEPPPFLLEWSRQWQAEPHDPWEVLVSTLRQFFPANARAVGKIPADHPLRRLIERTRATAIGWSPMGWDYRLFLPPPPGLPIQRGLTLTASASLSALEQAEQTLGMHLPPSYRALVLLTNGVGLSPGGFGRYEILGVEGVVDAWKGFQEDYAFIREQEVERGEAPLAWDATVMVPFLDRADYYCFDRARQQPDGECPVMFWDHEGPGAWEVAPTLRQWIDQHLEACILRQE